MEIISKEDAKASGLKFYFTGKPCKHGHVVDRHVSYGCVQCRKESTKRTYEKNRIEILRKKKEYREKNLETIKEKKRNHYNKNKEKIKKSARESYHNMTDEQRVKCRQMQRERYSKNKEKESERKKTYRINNIDLVKARGRDYYQRNKDEILRKTKDYRSDNKEKLVEYHKRYYIQNKEKIDDKNKRYAEINRESTKEYRARYYQENKAEINKKRIQDYRKNPIPTFMRKCLHRLQSNWRGGSAKMERTLGYSKEQLRVRIEFQFKEGMSWDNRGEWHIDHKKPISRFIEQGITDPKIINALSNLQPLWAHENLSKGAKY